MVIFIKILCLEKLYLLNFSSPEPQARMGLEPASVRPSVRLCVHTFKHEYLHNQLAYFNQILSEASLGWGKAALGFGPDQIGTPVSMATDSSHRVKMGIIKLEL